jgi:translation initiation factor 1 (eIF-1/SUI1)
LNKNTKKPKRKRKHHVSCYLDDREYMTFRDKRSKTYYNQSEYIRKCVLDKKITVIPGVRELIVDLKRIGNNLNQLTYSVNAGKVTVLGDDLKEINDELTSVWGRLSKVIKKVK